MIVQELHKIQQNYGYLPKSELRSLAKRIQTPLYRIHEVASFFPHFHLEPGPAVEVHVCHDMACQLRGAAQLRAELEQAAEAMHGTVHVGHASCLGRCDRAPAVDINGLVFVKRTAQQLLIDAIGPMTQGRSPAADADIGQPRQSRDPWQINPYEDDPNYAAVRQFIKDPDVDRVLTALKTADLRGMGGAGVWAHQKWNDVRNARGDQKYIVCNADESEPTTFKDRELLLRTPHLVLEGVILAGLLTGATRGYIYIRHEYPEQIEKMRSTIRQAESNGICGSRILGSDRDFKVEVFVSPGGYICGEQSALIEAMEDRRAQPRNKPPQLETNGLYDKPTLVSNVETFAWAPAIVIKGGEWYRDKGVRGCKGMRFFSLCGDVRRPGVYEVPNGITLRELIEEHAGGMLDGRPLKAFAPSGPSGGFLPAKIPLDALSRGWEKRVPEDSAKRMLKPDAKHVDTLDLELDLQRFRDLGLSIGAGMAVYDDRADIVDQALNCAEFFRNESCGKCVPCRLGSQKLVEVGTKLRDGGYDPILFQGVSPLIEELARTMEMTSICGLGVVAPKPLTSVIRFFPDDVARHLAKAKPAVPPPIMKRG
jgi:NADH:ubiquinone oxidoreductase subunit F (NADH-binding)/NADH:ubiquinone oxidoreductase subunit E